MKELNTICIMCPMGCPLKIVGDGEKVEVSGNTCKRGEIYGKEELLHPSRVITSLVILEDGSVASCKSSSPVPKERIADVVDAISHISAPKTTKAGDVLLKDALGLGVDIIATGVSPKSGLN